MEDTPEIATDDTELKAIGQIIQILEELAPVERYRITLYLHARYGKPPAT